MKLYYAPGACSLATHIALREAGVPFELARLDWATHRTEDGQDLAQVNSKGYVPALRLDDGQVLTENVAVLAYVASLNPSAHLAPAAGSFEACRHLEWLAFISTELHKSFSPLFVHGATEDVKQFALGNVAKRLGWLQGVFGARSYLLGEQVTVADFYLFTILSWGAFVNVDISQWPALKSFHERIAARPRVLEALQAEGLLGH
jgi:glutathione S-transferase